jgi:hypothetical protein
LIDSIHPESYRSLPHKLKFAYQWILPRWPNVQWLVKVDDDTVVRISAGRRFGYVESCTADCCGSHHRGRTVHRDGKWAELL